MRVSGERALMGWRAKVADAITAPVGRYTSLSRSRARALVGWAFLTLSILYVARTLRRLAR